MSRARTLGLPIERNNIKIIRPGPKYIIVEANYTVTVELVGGYTYDWNLAAKAEAPLIF